MPRPCTASATLALLLAAAILEGCAGGADPQRARLVQVTLMATTINAGQTGRANLIAAGERTEVAVWISGVPPLVASRPVHLYTYLYSGSCAQPAAAPTYALTAQVLAGSPSSSAIAPAGGPFTVTNVAPVPLDVLERGPYALRVFTAPADGHREIFCGDIRPA